jgi:hypothetical protein
MRKLFATFLVAMLATAGLAACGGDDDDVATNTETTNTETTEDDSGDDNSGDDSDDSGDDDSGDASGASDELQELLDQQSKARIRITYETTSNDSEPETMTLSQDGKGNQAVFTGTSVIITTADSTVSCDNLDSEPTCTELPAGMGELAGLGLTMFTAIGQGLLSSGLSDGDLDDDEVAGRDALCANVDYGGILGGLADLGEELGGDDADVPEDATVRICVDKETGFLLEFSGEAGNEFGQILATEVGEPKDSDFEPPAPVEDSGLGDINLDELIEEGAGN